jgi:hypothetical protein
LSFRSIGSRIGVSHSQARRLVEAAFAESAERTRKDSAVLLGEACDRVDGLIRSASVILYARDSSATERLRAATTILKCCEAKVRWLNLSFPQARPLEGLTRAQLIWSEVKDLDDAALDSELEAMDYVRADQGKPSRDEPAA